MTQRTLTEADLDEVWKSANFGDQPRMDVVKYGLLKVACGYHIGFTNFTILLELDLVTKNNRLTNKGKEQLYQFFAGNDMP